jgi:Rrf2 family protein
MGSDDVVVGTSPLTLAACGRHNGDVRITLTIDYAVRACAELAIRADGELTTAATLAEAQSIPTNYLLTLLGTLKQQGIVDSRRGVDGGYRLARPAKDISVADIIRAVDGPLADVGGQLVEDVAYVGAAAPLRETWVALRVAMRHVLEEVSLQALVDDKLPKHVRHLVTADDAWETRPEGL